MSACIIDLVQDLVYIELMKQVNVYDAKTRLSEILSRVEGGEEVTIAKAGRPVARLIPIHGEIRERIPGTAKGKVVIRKDFDDFLPDALFREFDG